ncbi:MAG: flavin-binding protein [Planctomycetota bacterium]
MSGKQPPRLGWPVDPDEIVSEVWTRLVRGKADRKHAFHHPAIATIRGGEPELRTVILRRADPDTWALQAHTDTRAGKVEQLRTHATAAWLFYDPAAKLQIRAAGPTQALTEGPIVEQAWDATPLYSRRCYLAPHAPGMETEAPNPNLPDEFREFNPDDESSKAGRVNFAVVRTEVTTLEWLSLAATGHTRGRFTRQSAGVDLQHVFMTP